MTKNINLGKSFGYAFRGLWCCVKNERNMRIHLVAALLVGLFSVLFGLETLEYVVLIVVIALVLVLEMLNTAMESIVDFQSPTYTLGAKLAKDIAAGAVLLMSLAAVVVGVFLFIVNRTDRLLDTLVYICESPYWLVIFILLIAVGFLFIINGVTLFRRKK